MINQNYRLLAAAVFACSLTACGNDAPKATEPSQSEQDADVQAAGAKPETEDWNTTGDISVPADQIADDQALSEILGTDDIPYPLYPNSSRYRIGDENGLKVILFQTKDSFEDVDAYYQSQANMPRLSAMNDYVRYSTGKDDNDPWATSNPGIVIHQFNSESERAAVGANDDAQTNIIMSFE